jgi:DMSO/TMAO reductase YedYZ molybdopterin-dependent catalytic subunit
MHQNKKKLTPILLTIAIITLLLTTTPQPTLASTKNLQITNLNGNTIDITEDQLLSIPKTYTYAELYCFGDLLTTGNWGGVRLSELLSIANVTSEVASLQLHATDGYKVKIPIGLAMQPNILIAYEKDDKPLDEGLRLILPEYNGAVWIAYIDSILMSETPSNYPEYTGVTGPILGQQNPQINPISTPTPTPKPTNPQPTATPTPTTTPQTPSPTHTVQPTPTPTENAASTSSNLLLYASILAVLLSSTTIVSINLIHKKRKQH